MKIGKGLLVLLLLCMLFTSPPPVAGCGPFFNFAVFTYSLHPDFPLEEFARGNLGILQSTYPRSYLYVAYRQLSGTGFSPQEQAELLRLWENRLKGQASGLDPGSDDPPKRWLELRARVPNLGSQDSIRAHRTGWTGEYYYAYYNCLGDSFQSAANALSDRIQRFGAGSAEVRAWVEAQDQVFANCAGLNLLTNNPGAEGPSIPPPLPPTAHPLLRADREYQRAAAYFYAGNFDAAREGFAAVAADQSSPWAVWAPYLIARCWVRKATVGATTPEAEREALQQAELQLKKVLHDPRLSPSHAAAQRLLGFLLVRLRPRERVLELARHLMRRNGSADFQNELNDYLILLDKFLGGEVTEETEEKRASLLAQRQAQLDNLRQQDDLTDWILSFQGHGPQAFEHSLRRWKETNSLPWLVAVLAKADPRHPEAAALLEAAARVKPDSPAFPTVAFQRARWLAESGHLEAARQEIDALMSGQLAKFPPSSLNLLLALRMKLARDLPEFLRFAARRPATVASGENSLELPGDSWTEFERLMFGDQREWNEWWKQYGKKQSLHRKAEAELALFDADAARVLTDKIPLRLLHRAAMSSVLLAHLRRLALQAAWVRAILLGKHAVGRDLAHSLQELEPSLKAPLDSYLAADSADAQNFAAVFAILKFPGLWPYMGGGIARETPVNRIDNYRDNWWCRLAPGAEGGYSDDWRVRRLQLTEPLRTLYPNDQVDAPAFLTQAEKAEAEKEWVRLAALPTAPNYLTQQVLVWAKKNPADDRVPEALHLAVRSTRYGCTDEETTKLSQAAFRFLHGHYPNSEWARKTKFWY